jgi:long-subunit fatty acid transport protein
MSSQNVGDAARLSRFTNQGTARVSGVSGAFGAMGGDISIVSINPAGLGEYKMSEFTFTPSITLTSAKAGYAGLSSSTSSNNNQFGFDNLGLVISKQRNGNLKASNFVIGLNRIADLNESFSYAGKGKGSITKRFLEQANGLSPNQLDGFEGNLAYKVGAIYDLDGDKKYERDVFDNESLDKNQTVNRRGQINEISVAYAANLENKLHFGVSLGFPMVSFEEEKFYTEEDKSKEVPFFDKLQFDEYLSTSGTGINFKAGVIYNAGKLLRLGASIHSPTWYDLDDNYGTSMNYEFTDKTAERYSASSPDGNFSYALATPWRAIGSIGSIYNIGKLKGFVNADIELVDYKTSRFDLTKYSGNEGDAQYERELNKNINTILGQSMNYRLGTEVAYQKLRIRVGTDRSQSPFSATNKRLVSNSFGLGLRENRFFIDFALVRSNNTFGYLPYSVSDPSQDPLVNVDMNKNRVVITCGFKI